MSLSAVIIYGLYHDINIYFTINSKQQQQQQHILHNKSFSYCIIM
jgi:hypothetical protein